MILNKKGIIREFDLVIYPANLVAVIGDMKEEVEKLYKPDDPDYDGFNPPEPEHPAKTYTVLNKEDNGFCIMIWVCDLENCKGSHFCHEVGHAALEIFKYIDAIVDVDNQEPFCYLLGNLFRLLNGAFYEYKDFLKLNKIKTTKKK